jgi:hypothetical protein
VVHNTDPSNKLNHNELSVAADCLRGVNTLAWRGLSNLLLHENKMSQIFNTLIPVDSQGGKGKFAHFQDLRGPSRSGGYNLVHPLFQQSLEVLVYYYLVGHLSTLFYVYLMCPPLDNRYSSNSDVSQ